MLKQNDLKPPPQGTRKLSWWLLLGIAAIAMTVYLNSLSNQFTFDDVAVVQNSEHVQNLDWSQIWSDNYWAAKDGNLPDILYRPFTIWSYLANQALLPNAAWAFHLTNVILHGLCTVMVAILAWRIFGSRGVALVAGLLFAVHPIHTEVVANIVGRAEMLAAIWSLAAILIYLPEEPLLRQTVPATRPAWHGLLVAACFFFAMLSKETPAALIGVFVFIDGWRWTFWPRESRPSLLQWFCRRALRYYLPIGCAFGVYLAMRIHSTGLMRDIRSIHPIVNPLVSATVLERIVTPFAILTKYLGLMVWPRVLSADYSAPSLMPTTNPTQPLPLIGLLLVLLAFVVSLRYWRRLGALVLTLGLFALSYALVSNFLRIGTIMGERLFYLPSVFVLIIAAWGVVLAWQSQLFQRLRLCRWTFAFLLLVSFIAMFVRTVIRNGDWHDNITLALATAHDNANSAKACTWAGSTLTTTAPQPWMVDFGAELLRCSGDLFPTYFESYWELAKYYGKRQDLANSTIYLSAAALYNPGASDIRCALSAVCDDLKAHAPQTYVPGVQAYLREHPMAPEARMAMAIVLRAQRKYDEAEKACLTALRLDDQYHEADAELAMIRLDMGKTDVGVATLRAYVMRISRSFDARCTMVKVLLDLDPKDSSDRDCRGTNEFGSGRSHQPWYRLGAHSTKSTE